MRAGKGLSGRRSRPVRLLRNGKRKAASRRSARDEQDAAGRGTGREKETGRVRARMPGREGVGSFTPAGTAVGRTGGPDATGCAGRGAMTAPPSEVLLGAEDLLSVGMIRVGRETDDRGDRGLEGGDRAIA